MWATQSLPELSEQLLAGLNEAGLPVLAARAEAYGENCLYSDGALACFAAMQTDYRITLTVETLTDAKTLGSLLEQTLEVIDGFPVRETPGPNPGYIGITPHPLPKGEGILNCGDFCILTCKLNHYILRLVNTKRSI